jgi:hypothetical protein
LSASSTGDVRPGDEERNLHEELHGSSLQSSRVGSAMSIFGTEMFGYEIPIYVREPTGDEDEAEAEALNNGVFLPDGRNDFIFSSPQLPLPPPFSTTNRSLSRADSLPSSAASDYMPDNPQASPIRSVTSTPVRDGIEGRQPTPDMLTVGEGWEAERQSVSLDPQSF